MAASARATKRPSEATELRAIRDLTRCGWTPEEICEDRGISLRTFYRRKARLAKLESRLPRRPGADPR